jgi:hypothetical protein
MSARTTWTSRPARESSASVSWPEVKCKSAWTLSSHLADRLSRIDRDPQGEQSHPNGWGQGIHEKKAGRLRVRLARSTIPGARGPLGTSVLKLGREYIVLEIVSQQGKDTLLRMEFSPREDSALFDSRLFTVVSARMPSSWSFFQTENGSFSLCPESWNVPGFWEAFYDREAWAVASYESEKRKILAASHAHHPGLYLARRTKVTSQTVWNRGPYRIDVENSNPGARLGDMSFQDQNNPSVKSHFNFNTGHFEGMAPSVERELAGDGEFHAGILKGLRFFGE